MAGSLFGWLRDWLGLEGISLLPYDDPELFDEMVGTMADYFMALYEPVLEQLDSTSPTFSRTAAARRGRSIPPQPTSGSLRRITGA